MTARINNQIAAFLMTLCGENNDETDRDGRRGHAMVHVAAQGQAPYWQNICTSKNRSEIFAQIESYQYAAQRAPEAFFFGAKQADEKKAKDQLTAAIAGGQAACCAPATPIPASKCWSASPSLAST